MAVRIRGNILLGLVTDPSRGLSVRFSHEDTFSSAENSWAVACDLAQSVLANDPENSDALTWLAPAERGRGG